MSESLLKLFDCKSINNVKFNKEYKPYIKNFIDSNTNGLLGEKRLISNFDSNIINELNYKLPEDQLIDKNKTNTDSSNLSLSLFKNKEQISFKKEKEEDIPFNKWKLYRVISGHNGWIRCVDIDPTNNW